MRLHMIDNRRADGGRALLDRSFHLFDTPRLAPLCRLLGHRPVVDGVDMRYGGDRSRWACCDRCGLRLLQPIDPDLVLGQPYTGPLPDEPPFHGHRPAARGHVDVQVVAWAATSISGAGVNIGSRGDEHPIAARVSLGRLGGLYVRTEGHGTWLQRRLNPTGYDARATGLRIHDGALHWEVWARAGHSSCDDPWWMRGHVTIDPRDLAFGPLRYSYADEGEPVTAIVRMPHGDEHPVTLQLQRQTLARKRLQCRAQRSWTVEWDAPTGIPTKPDDRGRVFGSAVQVTEAAATGGAWPVEACAAIAAELARDRSRYGYQPDGAPAA